jgi:hypothetical protein
MAKIVLLAEYLSINAVDLSSYTKKAELKLEVDAVDVTTYGDNGWTVLLGGIKSGELGWDALNDMAVGLLDSQIFALLGTVVAFEVRASNAARSTSNPAYIGSILIKEWQPIGGGIGDANSPGVSYPTSGAITRPTA